MLFLKEGAVLGYTNFNKKGKKISTRTHETLAVTKEGNKLTVRIKVTSQEVKEKKQFSIEYSAYCENGLLSLDMLC